MTALAFIAALALAASEAGAASPPEQPVTVALDADQMLAFSEKALEGQQVDLAVRILQSLLDDRRLHVRNEARFRLAALASGRGALTEAAALLRAIIDEEPGAQRARLELAVVQVRMGDLAASRKTFREAHAGGLPPDVARAVERFSAGMRERRRSGGSLSAALAPDSNINRGTNSGVLNTVFGDFELDEHARGNSGIGVAVSAEGFVREDLTASSTIYARIGASGDFYQSARFDDKLVMASAGPEFTLAGGTARILGSVQRRWFGQSRHWDAADIRAEWQRPLNRVSQIRASLALGRRDLRLGEEQDFDSVSASFAFERALDARSGLSATVGAERQLAGSPAFSNASGFLTMVGWRDLGRTTLVASGSIQHFEADERVAFYPKRRVEQFVQLSLAVTFRALTIRGWAPQVKVGWERNRSPVAVYQYDRVRAQIGFVRAF